MTGWLAVAGWAVLHLAWQGWVVWLVFMVARAALRDADPAARHAVAIASLAAIVAIPPLAVLLARNAAAAPSPYLLDPATGAAPGWSLALAGLGAVWLAGAAIALLRLLLSLRRLGSLDVLPLPALVPLVGTLAREMGISRAPRVVTAPGVSAPFVIGFAAPTLVLPADIARLLPEPELRALLRHELAHVRRRDFPANLLVRVLLCLAWPQPAARLAATAAATERERCCDEAAVAGGPPPLSLARALVALESHRATAPAPSLAGTDGPLAVRVRSLAAPRPRRRTPHTILVASTFPMLAAAVWWVAAVPAGSDAAARVALLVDPLVTIAATDPAGEFTLQLVGGRARTLVIGREPVPPARLRQDDRRIRALDAGGRTALAVTVRADGAGIAWSPRGVSPP